VVQFSAGRVAHFSAGVDTLAFVRERSASEIVSEAIRHYLKSVPARDRRLVAELAKKKG